DIVGKLDSCCAVVIGILVVVVAERVDFDSEVPTRIVLGRIDWPRVQEPAVSVVQLRAHGPKRADAELSLAAAVGIHRPHGPAAVMGVIDGSAAGALSCVTGVGHTD